MMNRFLNFALFGLLFLLTSCATLLPSSHEYIALLTTQKDGGSNCENVNPSFYSQSGGDEIISVRFGNGMRFFDLRPAGETKSDSAVVWLKNTYDGSKIQARLSQPETLKVGAIDAYVGEQVCIMFNAELFRDDELGLEDFEILADQQCCGVLTKQKIDNP